MYNALINKGVACKLQNNDGHKTVDISIPSARINIEVDGMQHYLNADQIMRDFKREYWSLKRFDFDTIHVPNIMVDYHLEPLADALAKVAKEYTEILEYEKKHPIKTFINKLFTL